MNYLLAGLIGVIVLATALHASAKQQDAITPKLNIPLMIRAIKGAENWDYKTRGAAGEWGPMQMRPGIYARYNLHEGDWIRQLMKEAEDMDLPVTPYFIALLHTAGGPAVFHGKTTRSKRDFAQRAANLYEDYAKQ